MAAVSEASAERYRPMDSSRDQPGIFGPRYLRFLDGVAELRPRLHRYCSRMIGSVLDGEDVVQDALLQAYRNLGSFDAARPLAPWLFRIAHNRCVDFLRQRDLRSKVEARSAVVEFVAATQSLRPDVESAIERLVLALPPKERACVLLKDVFGYSLEEIATLVDSTIGGVKAALNRGRSKLAALPLHRTPRSIADPGVPPLMQLYIERFNQRDWDGLRELIAADARLQVADRFAGSLRDSPYFANYDRWTTAWRLSPGTIDGEPVVVVMDWDARDWIAAAPIRLETANARVVAISDYRHCPWILPAAASVRLQAFRPRSSIDRVVEPVASTSV